MHKQIHRIKKAAAPAVITRAEAERLVTEITELTIKRNQYTSYLDEEINILREQYFTLIDGLEKEIDARTNQVRDWALGNPEEFGKKKSIAFLSGVIGFRTGMPKVKTLPGWTFARVIEKLASLPWGAAFLRIKQDLDKDALIAAQSQQTIQPSELREIGVRIDQEEAFYVEPAVTEQENRQVTSAKEGK